jgi:hypothetical protein
MLQIILFAWRDDDVGPTWGVPGGMQSLGKLFQNAYEASLSRIRGDLIYRHTGFAEEFHTGQLHASRSTSSQRPPRESERPKRVSYEVHSTSTLQFATRRSIWTSMCIPVPSASEITNPVSWSR